jgi:threonine dehydrogenase-like Zn-dependent dehydrogenase
VCGTDAHIFRGEYMANYPIVGGHELAGRITALGAGVTGWCEGERVSVDPNIFCGDCYFCRSNRANHCLWFSAVGVTRDGGFAEYVTAPARNLYRVPEGISFEDAALIEPVSCVVYALQRIRVLAGSSALIFGAGPMGQLLLQGLRRSGAASVTVVDRVPSRLELAVQLGAENAILSSGDEPPRDELRRLQPLGFDVVVDATGLPKVVEGMFEFAKPTAKILFFGVCPKGETVAISPYEVFENDWEIYGSFALRYTFYPAIDLISSGAVQVRPVVSHSIALGDLPAYMRGELRLGRAGKILVRP